MKGSYIVEINIEKDKTIKIGKLGNVFFKKGCYLYVGSALNGLEKRIQRHLRKNKKMHWHIDYLLRHATIKNVFYKESDQHEECIISRKINKKLQPIIGFGCSDCKCNSHLFYGDEKKIITAINQIGMNEFTQPP